jgi:hypothetical protein
MMSDNTQDTDGATDPVIELRARCEQLERELVQVKQKAESGIVKAHLQAEATRAGMIDLDGLKLLDISHVTVTADGEVQGATALMDKCRKEKPWLFGKPSTSAAGGAPPSRPPRQKLATEMTDAEYQTAREAILRFRP